MSAADANLDLFKHVLLLDHLPSAVGRLDGADVKDGGSHQEGSGGEEHGQDAADVQLKGC